MIEVMNLTKIYEESKALNNICFTVEPGEIVGIVGKSGSANRPCCVY
jgi:D-methionine transport system ATP-binding protein